MIKKRILKMAAVCTTMVMMLSGGALMGNGEKAQAAQMKTAKEVVKDMGVGWNLGNSLDSTGTWLGNNGDPTSYETAWGNPKTTKAMINKIKEAGFKTVRIPVSWGQHMGSASSYTVDEAWMDRVQEVVDYCIDNDLYVVLNTHHDDWIVPTYSSQSEVEPKLEKLWTQIATRFKSYDDKLIFETLNEPRVQGSAEEWNGGTTETRTVINSYNKVALEAIRSTGGNNAKRAVMMPTNAATGLEVALNDLVLPDDDNLIVSIHAYSPYNFAMNASGTSSWNSSTDKAELEAEFDRYYNKFVAKGIPVVIGEFGSINKGNDSDRVQHAKDFIEVATTRNIPCIWWDNNYSKVNEGETFGIFNRNDLTWYHEDIQKALISTYDKYNTNDDSSSSTTTDENGLIDGGVYYIKNINSNMYLDVYNGKDKNGTNVQQHKGNGENAQKFKVVALGDGYYKLVSQVGDKNKVLDVEGKSKKDGTNICIYKDNGGNNQQFIITKVGTNKYTIGTKVTKGESLVEVKNASKANKANVQQWENNGHKCQQWKFELAE
ncbi:putative Endoglucanase A [Clostridium bornimense]|uniref:Putative Endoglucanase A n=1 Tax=Clostridium bornimense TaxID=1216932 RepID=W6S1X5_9CLOT|nr:cellulase family glycosylhydrolase [Clostridium bornimense]CDM69884.1 putative Endoglucanase A [Clostridium bornimense]